jgi:hypothetical protein
MSKVVERMLNCIPEALDKFLNSCEGNSDAQKTAKKIGHCVTVAFLALAGATLCIANIVALIAFSHLVPFGGLVVFGMTTAGAAIYGSSSLTDKYQQTLQKIGTCVSLSLYAPTVLGVMFMITAYTLSK